jgi:predicted metal-dependent hydrolase
MRLSSGVLLHEMGNLKHHDHSPDFFALLSKDAPERRGIKGRPGDLVDLVTKD